MIASTSTQKCSQNNNQHLNIGHLHRNVHRIDAIPCWHTFRCIAMNMKCYISTSGLQAQFLWLNRVAQNSNLFKFLFGKKGQHMIESMQIQISEIFFSTFTSNSVESLAEWKCKSILKSNFITIGMSNLFQLWFKIINGKPLEGPQLLNMHSMDIFN